MASSQYASVPAATNGTTLEASRKTIPTSSAASTAAAALATTPVSPKAPANLPPLLAQKLPSFTPHTPLTGAAAIANRQQSRSPRTMAPDDKKPDGSQAPKQTPNPASIFTSNLGMSTPADAPPKEPSPVPSGLGGLPSVAAAAAAMDTSGSSPATSSSLVSNGATVDGSAGTVTAGPNTTDPALLPSDMSQYHTLQPQPPKMSEPLTATTPTTPGFGSATTPTTPFSPNNPGSTRGKHTCPHCHKTFTRHHNLKSHLLTHAHEKPFLCTTCNSRFRRLHDLKRHTKLHTGERPHVCPKCGRRFARGDALARHARGEGGCAGRRGSMGGMMNEDGTMVPGLGQDDGDGMEGLESLIDDGDGDVSMMDENGGEGSDGGPRRRASLPSIKTDFHPGHQQVGHQMGQHTPMTSASGYRPHNNTYPQLSSGARTASASGPTPGLFPPGNYAHGFKATTPASASSSMQTNNINSATATSPAATNSANTSILSPQNVLTDSPRAVSPGMLPSQPEGMTRDRTPSFTYTNSLPAPQRERDGMFVNHMAHTPAAGQQQNAHQQQGPAGGSGPAPQANMGGNGPQNNANMFAGQDGGLWAYIKTLEDRIKHLEEKVEQQASQQPQAQRQQQQPAAPSS